MFSKIVFAFTHEFGRLSECSSDHLRLQSEAWLREFAVGRRCENSLHRLSGVGSALGERLGLLVANLAEFQSSLAKRPHDARALSG